MGKQSTYLWFQSQSQQFSRLPYANSGNSLQADWSRFAAINREMKAYEGPVGHAKVRLGVRSGYIVLTAKAYLESDDTF
jgi:hypothetical protein